MLPRERVQLDQIKREQNVVDAIALVGGAVAIASALQRGSVVPDQQEINDLSAVAGMSSQAQQHVVEAMLKYLGVVRLHASSYPMVNILGPQKVNTHSVIAFTHALEAAIVDAAEAIDELIVDGACRYVVPTQPRQETMTPSGIASLIAESSAVSTWKLPFFVDRSMSTLPPGRAGDAEAVLRKSAELDGDHAIKSAIAFSGVDAAMMAAPAAGPIGVGLALSWALMALGKSLYEYQQLQRLFKASVDPDQLLRGLEHEPADKLGVILDLIGVLTI